MGGNLTGREDGHIKTPGLPQFVRVLFTVAVQGQTGNLNHILVGQAEIIVIEMVRSEGGMKVPRDTERKERKEECRSQWYPHPHTTVSGNRQII